MKAHQPPASRQANAFAATDHLGAGYSHNPPAVCPPREYPPSLPTVLVLVEGGVVQGCYSNYPVRVIVCDADHDGAEPERTTALPACGCVRGF